MRTSTALLILMVFVRFIVSVIIGNPATIYGGDKLWKRRCFYGIDG